MDEMKRDRIVAYLRHRIEEFGIRLEDLAPEPEVAAPLKVQGVDRYRSANGDRWDGEGEMPEWLRAQSAQVSPSIISRLHLRSAQAPGVKAWHDAGAV